MFRLFVCLTAALAMAPQTSGPDSARALLSRSIDALGGETALRHLRSLEIESIGHEFFIDQSERPEGPFVTRYVQTLEKRDIAGGRSRIETQERFVLSPDWSGAGSATTVDADAAVMTRGTRYAPAQRQAFEDGRERLELGPERVLLTALAAPDLTLAPDAMINGIAQRVATFGWRGRRVTLFIDSGDYVPTALETRADDSYGIWGTVRNTTYYSLWTLLPGGIRYPLQTDRTWNGVASGSATITKVIFNTALDSALFVVPADMKAAFAALPSGSQFAALNLDTSKRVDIEPGKVAQYGGNWNVGVAVQPDGLVILEAPIGSHYSVQVLDEVAKRYPNQKVKAVVTTSDAWPHLGGVREYVARSIPVYGLALNQPILERLLKADYASNADALAKSPKPARFTWVSGKTTIGSGDSRIELYPIRGENGERMLMAYFPAIRLLYTSDEIQRQRDGQFFMPEFLFEVKDAIARERLDVVRVFGVHVGATPWSEIEAAIASASAASSPRVH